MELHLISILCEEPQTQQGSIIYMLSTHRIHVHAILNTVLCMVTLNFPTKLVSL